MSARLALWCLLLAAVLQTGSRATTADALSPALQVVRAAGRMRVLEGRLAGSVVHAPWRARTTAPPLPLAVRAAALRLRALHAEGTAPSDLALAHVILGRRDLAIATLERSARTADLTAEGATDLAALLLADAGEEDAYLAAKALALAEDALALAPGRPQALFNRAAALERLGSHDGAAIAWADYLRSDPRGGWADEAQARLAQATATSVHRLTTSVRARFASAVAADHAEEVTALAGRMPQLAREYLDDMLLPRWAMALDQGDDADAEVCRRRAALLAQILHTRHGDDTWRDLCARLAGATGAYRRRLSAAVRHLQEARQLAEAGRFDGAARVVGRALDVAEGIPPLEATARFWQAYVHWHQDRRHSLTPTLAALGRECAIRDYRYLESRTRLLESSTLAGLGRYDAAVSAARQALRLFHATGEREYAASMHALLGFDLSMQGDLRGAWAEVREALRLLRDVEAPRRRFVILEHAAQLSARSGLPRAALTWRQLLVTESRAMGDPGALVRQLLGRARLLLDVGTLDAARRDIDEAARWLEQVPDAAYRRQFADDLRVEQARSLASSQPERAAELLARAIEGFSARGLPFDLATLHLERGRVLARTGQGGPALAEWQKGLVRFEDEHEDVRDDQLRISHFSRSWQLYDEAVAQLVARGDTLGALDLVERSRARALLDSLAPRQRPPRLASASLPARLAADALVLVYHALPTELLVWRLQRQGVTLTRARVTPRELDALVADLRHDTPTVRQRAHARLATILLGAEGNLPAWVRTLFVVPDRHVAHVPFASLPIAGFERLLVDTTAVTFAPSLSLLESAMSRVPTRASTAALFAGHVTRGPEPGLPALPLTRREILSIASVYQRARTYVDGEATRDEILRALTTADVLHVAGHAVSNPVYPSRSRLLAATGNATDGTSIGAGDIAGLEGVRTRLVVLSACSTASGAAVFGEGLLSLARPFLAAGVPDVVGTLWDIDDRAGMALMPRFHAWYARGVGAAESLRRAQMELRSSQNPFERDARTWAAFVLTSGVMPPAAHDRLR